MYCTSCGKQINYDSPVCVECARAAEARAQGGWQNGAQNGAYQQGGANTYENYYSFEPINPDIFGGGAQTPYGGQQKSGSMKNGLVRAIIAAVLAQLSATFLSLFLEAELGALIAGMLLTALPAAIVALCLGVASIKCFRAARAKNEVLPIPTLIIGIYATVNAALALFLCMVCPLMFL